MSLVTNIILTCPVGQSEIAPPFDAINVWLREQGCGELTDLAPHAGGYKGMECEVWGGALNYLSLDAFLEVVQSRQWRLPECVQIFVQEQEDDEFRVIFPLRQDRAHDNPEQRP